MPFSAATIRAWTITFGRRLHNRQQRLQRFPQFITVFFSCHVTYNAQRHDAMTWFC
jgi:hypothetical protein